MYTPIFLLRRIFFATLIFSFSKESSSLVQTLFFFEISLFNLLYIIKIQPYAQKVENWIEAINEVIIILIILFSLPMTELGRFIQFSIKQDFGIAMIILFILAAIINLGHLFLSMLVNLLKILQKKLKQRKVDQTAIK